MLRYGGGGHRRVGTCQVPMSETDRILEEILQELNTVNWQVFNIETLV
jgi:nanoRNase/pAp phosphatase (c-di-AMP/oligoRNAs hydrolase)